MKSTVLGLLALSLMASSLLFTTSCTTASSISKLDRDHPAVVAQRQRIAQEPRGSYYVGRRYWLEGTRFWGFVRRPGEPWDQAKLVVMNESKKHQPDRLPEVASGKSHGFDHNHEYKLTGHYSGQRIYDPNSDQILPEFVLTDYELVSKSPGFLFHPNQKFPNNQVPRPPF